MEKYIVHSKENFDIEVNIPGSKSVTNRALILAAFSKGKATLKNILFSDDTLYMIDSLKKLGNNITVDTEKKEVTILSNEDRNFGTQELFIGNSGTSIRFLASYICTGVGEVILTGVDRMKERPIKPLVDSLRSIGADIEYIENEGFPPILIKANRIKGGSITIDASKSSQYLTSLMMAAPYMEKGLEINISSSLVSLPYIKITEKMMKDFGVVINHEDYKKFMIDSNPSYSLDEYIIEGDASSASYFFAMALIGNGIVKLNNINKNSMQGDIKFLDLLIQMGLEVLEENKNYIKVKGVESYDGISCDMYNISDVAQTLSVVALFAKTKTEIKNVYNMRIKETDRIDAVCNEIKKIGADIIEYEDGFTVIPKSLSAYNSVEIKTYDDHRMAMSFALSGLKIDNMIILDPNCVSKTFPNYFEEFEKIYK